MKKLLYVGAVVLLSACGSKETAMDTDRIAELDELKTENIQLKNAAARKDSMINVYALYVNEIQDNLALITGEQRFVDTAGRVEKFAKRYGSTQARRADKTEEVKEESEAASAPA